MKILFIILILMIFWAVMSLLFAAFFAINDRPKELKEAISIAIAASMAAAFLSFLFIVALVEV